MTEALRAWASTREPATYPHQPLERPADRSHRWLGEDGYRDCDER